MVLILLPPGAKMRAAARLEAELLAQHAGRSATTWRELRRAYERTELAGLAVATQQAASTVFERFIRPKTLDDLTAAAVAKWATKLRVAGLAEPDAEHNRLLLRSLYP